MKPNEILSASLIDVIFDGRNKDYGAYQLRKTYSARIKKALLVTTVIAGLAFGGAALAGSLKKKERNFRITPGIQLTEIPDKVPEKLPEPIKKPDPPVKTEIYTAPLIVDKEVLDKPAPTIEDLDGAKIDLFKQDGVTDDKVPSQENIDGGAGIIPDKERKEPDDFAGDIEIQPKYSGNWEKFLRQNLNPEVPVQNNAPTGTYSVVIQFVVDKEGNVSDIKPLTDHGYGMEQEAVRVLKKAMKWSPAIQNGYAVKAYRRQPITFQVLGEE
ncbi:MAG: TonB family protein [Chitinophagaceae bacterium]